MSLHSGSFVGRIGRHCLLFLLYGTLLGCPANQDKDGDGSPAREDCDDDNPLRSPEFDEVCDGIDNDCVAGSWAPDEGSDYDGDGSPSCIDCDDQNPTIYPGAEPVCEGVDADCDGIEDNAGSPLGGTSSCPAFDCRSLLKQRPDSPDGDYWIHAGEPTVPFEVACDMTTDEGGWIHLALDDDDGVIVGSRAEDNPWYKCDDDAALFYRDLTEADLPSDYFVGSLLEVPLGYKHPLTGDAIDPRGIAALRPLLGELHSSSRMVATIGDNDGGEWEQGSPGGLEVYVVSAAGDWVLLTPGGGGDCGGGGWPSEGSETGFYVWGSSAEDAQMAGDTGLEVGDWSLGVGEVLPVAVQLVVSTGGGVSFGFEGSSFRVR